MNFIPLYFQDKLTIINPAGTIGVLTSGPRWTMSWSVSARPGLISVPRLPPSLSSAPCMATVCGSCSGICSITPRFRTLLVCGRNRSGSLEELQAFFDRGLEPAASPLVSYETAAGGEVVQTCKIKGTNRLIDNLVRPDHFRVKPQFRELGDPKDEQTLKRLQEFFHNRQNLSPGNRRVS